MNPWTDKERKEIKRLRDLGHDESYIRGQMKIVRMDNNVPINLDALNFVQPEKVEFIVECSWCGGEVETAFKNRQGEVFCTRSHRMSSNNAVRRLVGCM